MTTRVHLVALEAHDTSLGSYAADLQSAIDTACADIETAGGRVLGPVSLAPLQVAESNPSDGEFRDNWTTECGIIAAITYETTK